MIALCAIINSMNSKNRRTLEAIFSEPTRANIKWDDLVSLLLAVGAQIIEGHGSGTRFAKDQHLLFIHRPHPEKEIKKYQARDARAFLESLEVRP